MDVFSASGDQDGYTEFSGNGLKLNFTSVSGGIGRLPGQPVAVVTLPAGGGAVRMIPPASPWKDVHGTLYNPAASEAQFRTRGGISIDSLTPGGGLQPEGMRVSIEGRGFTPATALQIEGNHWHPPGSSPRTGWR